MKMFLRIRWKTGTMREVIYDVIPGTLRFDYQYGQRVSFMKTYTYGHGMTELQFGDSFEVWFE